MAQSKREKPGFEEAIRLAKQEDGPAFYGPNDKWTAMEELILLSSMQHYGYGNWPKHAENLTKNIEDKEFTGEEVQEHYIKTYREGEISEAMKPLRSGIFKSSVTDHVSEKNFDKLKCSDEKCAKDVPEDFLKRLGYTPFRNDFKEEYEPTAEDLLQNVALTDVDSYEKNYNLLILDCYRHKIEERMKIKALIQQYDLVKRYYDQYKPFEDDEDEDPHKKLSCTNIHHV